MLSADDERDITLRLSRQTIQEARIAAAIRSTSVSALITSQIEQLVDQDEGYEPAMQRAMARMEKGFHLGGVYRLDRDSLHDRHS